MIAGTERVVRGDMAGRQAVRHAGLELRVSPDSWARRWLPFKFYFESTNPSFRIDAKRVSAAPEGEKWLNGEITIEALFADGTLTAWQFEAPSDLQIGQSTRFLLPNVYTAHPGQTIIRLQLRPPIATVYGGEFKTLYSYQVRPEEQLILAVIGPVVTLALVVAGAAIQKWLLS